MKLFQPYHLNKALCFLLLTGFLLAGFAAAEPVELGVKGGINFSNIENNTYVPGTTDYVSFGGNTLLGYNAGVFLDVNLYDFFYFQPEAMVILKGSQPSQSVYPYATTFSLPYLEFPLLLKAKVFSIETLKVNLLAGPYFSFFLNSNTPINENPFFKGAPFVGQTMYNEFEMGLTLGVSLELDNFLLDARYDSGLTGISLVALNGGANDEGLNEAFILSLGYKILKF